MASILQDTFVDAATYNALPHIHQVADVPKDQAGELELLRGLLAKHGATRDINVRLIHKHYDVPDDEIMVFKEVSVPSFGPVQVMRSVPRSTAAAAGLQGIHYFVNEDGALQAYEYGDAQVPNMSSYEPLLAEFCHTVVARGLQHKFGLKLKCEAPRGATSWTEFEFPNYQATIMIPDGLPTPDGHESAINVVTEWPVLVVDGNEPSNDGVKTCTHTTTCTHCKQHPSHADDSNNSSADWFLGGHKIEPGTSVHSLVAAVIKVW